MNYCLGRDDKVLKIAVCDDEEYMRKELLGRIEGYLGEKEIAYRVFEFGGGEELLETKEEIDILFLDIEMQGLSGMETAKRWRLEKGQGIILFITVFAEYVYDAFEVEAVDYLLKPIQEERFSKVMDRIFHKIYRRNQIFLPARGNTCQIILLDKVYYFEVINHKIFAHTKEEVLELTLSMRELEGYLDYRFFRCHRSYFVNLEFVMGCQGGMLRLEDGERVPISRLRLQEFSKRIIEFLK